MSALEFYRSATQTQQATDPSQRNEEAGENMFEEKFVTFSPSAGLVDLVGATILVAEADFVGVRLAVNSLAEDFGHVTKGEPRLVKTLTADDNGSQIDAGIAIIVGSIESSWILQRLEKEGKLDCTNIRGKWESFTTAVVCEPLRGWRKALVIAGSDKRGAIFGIYSLSEQIGVSPCVYPAFKTYRW